MDFFLVIFIDGMDIGIGMFKLIDNMIKMIIDFVGRLYIFFIIVNLLFNFELCKKLEVGWSNEI